MILHDLYMILCGFYMILYDFYIFWIRSLSSSQAPTREMAPKLGCHSPQTCSATRHTHRACWRQPGRSPTMPFGPAEAVLAPALMFRVPRFMGRAIPFCWRTVRSVPLHGFAALACCGKVPDPAQCTVGSKPYLDGTSPSPYVGTYWFIGRPALLRWAWHFLIRKL